MRCVLLSFGIAASALMPGCADRGGASSTDGTGTARPSTEGLPNIVFAVYDNTRFDRYSINGNLRNTTPFFDKLAAEGIYLTKAIAPATWTFPSHASMFTGYRNHQLKVDYENSNHLVLDSNVRTIAQILSDRGYLTVSYADHPHFGPVNSSLSRGFRFFDILFNPLQTPSLAFSNVPDGILHDRREAVTRPTAAENLELRKGYREKLGDSPTEYVRPIPESEVFPPIRPLMDDYLSQRYAHMMDVLKARGDRPFFLFLNLHNGPRHLTTPVENAQWLLEYLDCNNLGRMNPESFNDIDNAFLKSDYIIAFCDATLEAIHEWITETPGMENTVFIVASDHGQAHGEHGETVYYKHAFSVPWEYMVRAPAVIHFPESAGSQRPSGRIDEWVSLNDLFFTIAEIGDAVSTPYVKRVSDLNGASILARIRENRFDEFVVSESYMVVSYDEIRELVPEMAGRYQLNKDDDLAGNVYTFYKDQFKFTYGPQVRIIGRPDFVELTLLFDIEADPLETRNLARERPDVVKQMMAFWRRHRELEAQMTFDALPALEFDDATAEMLKATGYSADSSDGD